MVIFEFLMGVVGALVFGAAVALVVAGLYEFFKALLGHYFK